MHQNRFSAIVAWEGAPLPTPVSLWHRYGLPNNLDVAPPMYTLKPTVELFLIVYIVSCEFF